MYDSAWRPEPRVFTIPASVPFLSTLIEALVTGRLVPGFPGSGDPLALATATIYLPTRRACRLARDVFLDVLESDAAILPRIVAIGDVDEDEIAFAEAGIGEMARETLDLPKELGGLERQIQLAKLILKWAQTPTMRRDGQASLVANSPAAALALAGDLARLMDDMVTRQVPWDRLDGLVPDDVDEYWQNTLEFLRIVSRPWQAHLAQNNRIEPAERRNRLIAAEAARLRCRCRTGDRRGIHRLDPGNRDTAHNHRQAAAWRAGAAGTRHRSRRSLVAPDCWPRWRG